MNIFNTPDKRKSVLKTTLVISLLFILMFVCGLTYYEPVQEKGIEVILGVNLNGSNTSSVVTTSFKQTQKPIVQSQKESVAELKEQVITQKIEEHTVTVTDPKKDKKEQQQKENKKEVEETQKQKKLEISEEITNALANILGAKKSVEVQGKGNDGFGDKGNDKGNPYAHSFYQAGNGKGWGLNGRTFISGEKIKQNCNESGRVVVRIEVDKSGSVVKVEPGVKGTTNASPCLIEAARKTALTYHWNPDNKAPELQIGFIEINFSLTQE